MENTRLVVLSDVHLCHKEWYGRTARTRLNKMVDDLAALYEKRPYTMHLFLGDYSLDHWEHQIQGSYINEGISNTKNFVDEFLPRLPAPSYLLPGNHEQYGEENWQRFVGNSREEYFTLGGYLIISCDNFSGLLDPDVHSDGVYTPTKLDYVKRAMDEYPTLPVILVSHFFNVQLEPEEFFEFIGREKRIVCLMCGHDHIYASTDLGDAADHVHMYHDGHYSYAGGDLSFSELSWGFSEVELTDLGVRVKYIEPAADYEWEGVKYHHDYREREEIFYQRRDK